MTTRRKHCWLFISLAAGIGLSIYLYFLYEGSPAVSLEAEERIQFGMTEEEVMSILKAPPGDYRTRTVLYGGLQRSPEFLKEHDFHGPIKVDDQEPLRMEAWITNRGKMRVWFDQNGRVAGKGFNEPAVSVGWLEDTYESILVKLRLKRPRTWCVC